MCITKTGAQIEREIERARHHMHDMAIHLGVVHPEVLRCSEKLDQLLLEFYAVHPYDKR